MTLNQFRQALTKQPFRLFRIILADGRSFTIEHPDFVAMDPSAGRSRSTKRTAPSISSRQCSSPK